LIHVIISRKQSVIVSSMIRRRRQSLYPSSADKAEYCQQVNTIHSWITLLGFIGT